MVNNENPTKNGFGAIIGSGVAALTGRIPLGIHDAYQFTRELLSDETGDAWYYNSDSIIPRTIEMITQPFDTLRILANNVLSGDIFRYGPDWGKITASLEAVSIIALPLVVDTAIHGLAQKQDQIIEYGAGKVQLALEKLDSGLLDNLGIKTKIASIVQPSKIKSASHVVLDIWEKPWHEATIGKDRAKKWLVRTPVDGLLTVLAVAALTGKSVDCLATTCG